MASLATYAKLTPPDQFIPLTGVNVIFKMQYSEDLTTKYATLIIDGYSETVVSTGEVYTGLKRTHQLTTAIGGQWYTEYVIDSSLLGKSYPERGSSDIYVSGKMQARVEIGDELDGEGHVINPVFTSNVTLVDMIVLRSETIRFLYQPYNAIGSTFTVYLHCDYFTNYGASGSNDVQSYRIFLYDHNYNLINDTGELYDWDSNLYGNTSYTFYGLQDNSTYYIKGRITLNGGLSFNTSEYTAINVHYSDIPSSSELFTLTPYLGTIKMSLDLTGVTHTKIVFSRTRLNENDYLEIVKVENPGDIVNVTDKFPIPTTTYTYKAVVFNGDIIVGTYYNNYQFTDSCVTISDIFGSYSAVGKITKHPINRNDRGSILETMDSKFPYHILNGEPDYDSGTVDGFFAELDECTVDTDNGALSKILRAWLNNGKAKLLTYYTGEAWIVTVNGVSTTDPENNDAYNTSFNWTQIGDATRMSEYVRLGLIHNE